MDIRKVKKLIELMEESDIAEIEIKEGEDAVRISRGPVAGAVVPPTPAAAAPATPAARSQPTSQPEPRGQVLAAPMVGTFYRAPSPESPPFVDIGDRVKAGDTVCIIESMKMMNEVKADRAGRIEAILVQNADAVEYDQPLLTIV